jgi:hypothetical protein
MNLILEGFLLPSKRFIGSGSPVTECPWTRGAEVLRSRGLLALGLSRSVYWILFGGDEKRGDWAQ